MPWDLTGNNGTSPANNFLGTTDNRALSIRTNNAERMRVTPNGNVGIGTTELSRKLQVQGSEIHSGGSGSGYSFSNRETSTFVELPSGGERWVWYASGGTARLWSGSDRLSVALDPNLNTTVIVGPGSSGRLKIRHIDGKHWQNDDDDALHLNWGTGKPVLLGFGNNTQSSLFVSGNVGIGTATPASKLSVVGPGASELAGTARSSTLVASAGNLGTSAGTELSLASLGFSAQGNNVSLGIRGRRAHTGDGWTRTSIGLGMDVDNTVRASEASLWLNAAGGVGIGTATPGSRLTVNVPASSNPISAMSIDVQSFSTQSNAQASHYFRVRDIGAAPPEGLTHFMIRGDGNVEVAGDIRLSNADCAEDFDISGTKEAEPGTVMVIDEEGALKLSEQAYDRRVAGVISGGGDYKSGIILDRQAAQTDRMPVALMGKVNCKVDARYAPIEVGDQLTTSTTPGHAMKVDDTLTASGAVIGKALQGLRRGQGLVPILVSLQ